MRNVNFKIARIKADLTQVELANSTGIPKTRVVRFETGRINISDHAEECAALALAMGVKAEDLHASP
jgi:DNA-binding XRE family transcriptional regulator